MSLSLSVSEVSYEVAGHYFIKIFLEFDKDDSKSSSLRTEVSQTTQTPHYKTSTFQFSLPKGHALFHKKSYFSKLNTTGIRCILQACQIERTSTEKDPSLKIAGTANLIIYPNETLQESLNEMKVVYFTSSLDKNSIGKAIVSISIQKEPAKTESSNQRVLDPMESFEQLPKTPSTRNGSAKGLEDTVPDMPTKQIEPILSRETSNPSLAKTLSGLLNKPNEKPIKEYMRGNIYSFVFNVRNT